MASQTWQRWVEFGITYRVSVVDVWDWRITVWELEVTVWELGVTARAWGAVVRDCKLPIDNGKPLVERGIDDWNRHHLLRMRNHYARKRKEITIWDYRLVFLSRWATTCQRSAFWWDSQNTMAEQLSSEDLTGFFDSLRCIIERTASVYHASDLVGLHCRNLWKEAWETHKNACRQLSLSQNPSLGELFEVLENSLI